MTDKQVNDKQSEFMDKLKDFIIANAPDHKSEYLVMRVEHNDDKTANIRIETTGCLLYMAMQVINYCIDQNIKHRGNEHGLSHSQVH